MDAVVRESEREAVRWSSGRTAEIKAKVRSGAIPARDIVSAAMLGLPAAQEVSGIAAAEEPLGAIMAQDDPWRLADMIVACAEAARAHPSWPDVRSWCSRPWAAAVNAVRGRRPLRWRLEAGPPLHDEFWGACSAARRMAEGGRRPAYVVVRRLLSCCDSSFLEVESHHARVFAVREMLEAAALAASGRAWPEPWEADDVVAMAEDGGMPFQARVSSVWNDGEGPLGRSIMVTPAGEDRLVAARAYVMLSAPPPMLMRLRLAMADAILPPSAA